MVRKLLKWLWIVACTLIALLTVCAGNGGRIDPEMVAFPSILFMMFPFWMFLNLAILIVNFFCLRKLIIVNIATIMLTLGPTLSYCPLNFCSHTPNEEEKAHSFEIMTFNVFGFHDDEEIYPDGTNRSMSTIIASDADIVSLQEALYCLGNTHQQPYLRQVDSLQRIYPYSVAHEGKMVSILSKYPLKEIILPQPESYYAGFCAAETYIDGDTLLIVSLHLESIGLDDHDKQIYSNMTEGEDTKEWASGGKILYHKLSHAFRQRAKQARLLRCALDSLDYRNVIVAGDFNDISDCFAMREIADDKMKSVFRECGFGPRITYHNNRFYFNIDHILFQGVFKPVKTWRGNIKSSDHYPVYAIFVKN